MPHDPQGHFPRLTRPHYQGRAVVFWTNTMEQHARGWLTPTFHAAFREMLLHAASRYALWCPVYCLMPDHLHHLWMGMHPESDQLNAMKFLRGQLKPLLGPGRQWQHQAYDHVLREKERQRNAFAAICFYLLENPVRAGLVETRANWPFSGAVIPGYPRLNPLVEGYWERFWKLYASAVEDHPPPTLPSPAS